MEWAIDHAEGSKYLDDWYVSTDDAIIANSANGRVIHRPAYLAADEAPTEGVLVHALYTLPVKYDYAVIIQPTSPKRLSEDIDRCIEIAVTKHGEHGLTGCVSYVNNSFRNGAVYVCNVEHFLQRLSFDAAHHYDMPAERSLDIDHTWQFE